MATTRTFLPIPTKLWTKRPPIHVQKAVPKTEEEYVEEYQDRIHAAQRRQLYPLQEDLADWLNKTLGISSITGDNFLDMLDNGVILCQLARVIHTCALQAKRSGNFHGSVPFLNGKYFDNAARRSFFARDNMETFIRFCRELGVHQNLLFESDDLVMQTQPRQVVLCVLELSRISTQFQIEPPGLVQLEKEIEEEEQAPSQHTHTQLIWQFRPSPDSALHSRSASEGSSDEWTRENDQHPLNALDSFNELDMKVEQATTIARKHCQCDSSKCSKLPVTKVGNGKYNIAGRHVFVRLLKGRHMMVRVGGGWDTLEHFLLRHDPCQVRVHRVNADTHQASTYLHIRAKYRSPPPL